MNYNKLLDKFFCGINYWSSESATNMWENFNPESIENDFKLLSCAGITHLRVFPLWNIFQPLHAIYNHNSPYEYTFKDEKPLPDSPAGKTGVNTDAIEKFKILCNLAEKYNLSLIVAVITGHMSFRTFVPPAFEGKALLSDPTVLKWQRRFIKYFVNYFKEEKSIIAWDLGNEPENMTGADDNIDKFYVWCSYIADSIRICDNTRPIISGIADSSVEKTKTNLRTISETCDINTTHPYNIFSTASEPLNTIKPILDLPFKCRFSEDIGKIPTFIQEFGAIGYMNCSYKTEAEFYRASLLSSLSHGCHGVMWWCAFDQGHFDHPPYRWNNIGSDYGFFDKNLKEKPIVEKNREFKKLLSLLPGGKLPPHKREATVLVPRDDYTFNIDIIKCANILAKQANIDVNFSYVLDTIPQSSLYIMPCFKGNHSITKQCLDQVLENVEKGSVLYISADTGLLRQIPDITGVTIEYREQVDSIKELHFDDNILKIKTQFFLKPESSKAQVIGTDESGEGIFFKYKYGKGFVYFMTLPYEASISQTRGAFFKDDQPDYSVVYRELAKEARIERICDSNNKFIRLTEHEIDENSLYVVLINYNNKEETAELTIKEGYSAEVIWGENLTGNTIKLKKNYGLILKLKKN